jgi:hypothetical protein
MATIAPTAIAPTAIAPTAIAPTAIAPTAIAPTAIAAAGATGAPVTPPRKTAIPVATVLADVDNPGKTLTVCYCSVHGMQNASTNKRGSSAHSNKDCPYKSTKG